MMQRAGVHALHERAPYSVPSIASRNPWAPCKDLSPSAPPQIIKKAVKNDLYRGQSYRTVGRAFALQVNDLGLIPGILHGPPSTARKAKKKNVTFIKIHSNAKLIHYMKHYLHVDGPDSIIF